MSEEFDKKKSDYLLKLALEEWLEQDPETLQSEKDDKIPHEYSEEHKKRMKKIFKMADKVERKAEYRRRNVRIAACMALFLCFSAVTVTRVEAFRLPIMKFFLEVKDKSALIGAYSGSRLHLSEENQRYEPGYVPEGYVVVAVKEYESGFYIKYESEKDHTWYRYCCWNLKENIDADVEDGTLSETEINGFPAVVLQKEGEIRINVSGGAARFYLDGQISYEEAVKILSSIDF